MKREKVKTNLPYALEVWEGTDFSGDNSVAGDERERVLIGSEIKPVCIGKYKEKYTGNGTFSECEYSLVQQDGKILLVEQWVEYHTYGYSIQREDWDYKVYEIPVAKEFKFNEFLKFSGAECSYC